MGPAVAATPVAAGRPTSSASATSIAPPRRVSDNLRILKSPPLLLGACPAASLPLATALHLIGRAVRLPLRDLQARTGRRGRTLPPPRKGAGSAVHERRQ